MQVPENMQKITRTCVYFARGECIKGEKCLFQHSVDITKVRALGGKRTRQFTLFLASRRHVRYAVSGQWAAVVQATNVCSRTSESLPLYLPRYTSSAPSMVNLTKGPGIHDRTQAADTPSPEVCQKWIKGVCKYGDRCFYAHRFPVSHTWASIRVLLTSTVRSHLG